MANPPEAAGGGSVGGAGESARGKEGFESGAVTVRHEPTLRGILRVVATVVISAFALYLVYLLWTPIAWLIVAMFVAVSVSAPVNILQRRMPRGLAILLVYIALVMIPIGIGAILIPPAVTAASDLVSNLPSYVRDLNATIQESDTLRSLNEDFNLVSKLEDAANDAAGQLDDVAATLANLGAGLVGSLFALVTILVMSVFMVAKGRQWVNALIQTRSPEEAEALGRAVDRIAVAVSSYVGGALAQATIAGVAAYIVLEIIGAPAPLALAVIVGVLDVIPLIGATIGAIIVGLITIFTDFPTMTIIWAVFAIVYQQFENYVVQPRIQSRAVQLDPFIIVIAAIFGGTLLGVPGALLAIPAAAASQIAVREYMVYRKGRIDRMSGVVTPKELAEGGHPANKPPG